MHGYDFNTFCALAHQEQRLREAATERLARSNSPQRRLRVRLNLGSMLRRHHRRDQPRFEGEEMRCSQSHIA